MTGHPDKAEIEIPCPKCKQKTRKSVEWIKSNSEFVCNCSNRVRLDASQFITKIAESEKAIEAFKKKLKNVTG